MKMFLKIKLQGSELKYMREVGTQNRYPFVKTLPNFKICKNYKTILERLYNMKSTTSI